MWSSSVKYDWLAALTLAQVRHARSTATGRRRDRSRLQVPGTKPGPFVQCPLGTTGARTRGPAGPVARRQPGTSRQRRTRRRGPEPGPRPLQAWLAGDGRLSEPGGCRAGAAAGEHVVANPMTQTGLPCLPLQHPHPCGHAVDPDALDRALGAWLAGQPSPPTRAATDPTPSALGGRGRRQDLPAAAIITLRRRSRARRWTTPPGDLRQPLQPHQCRHPDLAG
jgi:hypothetical protein